LLQEYDISLSIDEIQELAESALDVKDADRLDNIKTEHTGSIERITSKIQEFDQRFRARITRDKPYLIEFFDIAVEELRETIREKRRQESAS